MQSNNPSSPGPAATDPNIWQTVVLYGALLLTLVAWHFPMTVGGKMPAGGDVAGFFLPLMRSYQDAVLSGRSLLWNHNWGFGFPQVAESQTGAYYPIRWALYRFLDLETAFVAELLLHLMLAGAGAALLGRRMGLSRTGAFLAAVIFVGSGFFVSHLAHQWAYSAAAWLPWILAIVCRGTGSVEGLRKRWSGGSVAILAIAVALQLLVGHYQVAFFTLVAVTTTALAGCDGRPRLQALSVLMTGCLLGAGLAAIQWVQTLGLLRVAGTGGRGLAYASEFAVSPFHLAINLVLPSAFHVIPAWRPVVWDPFHTSPEEVLPAFGFVALVLVPLGLFSGSPRLRRIAICLAAVGFSGAVLPFVPGVRLLLELPGIGMFRAPARWLLIASVGVGLLAGNGLDAVRNTSGRTLRAQVIASVAAITFWLVLATATVAALAGTLGNGVEHRARLFVYRIAQVLGPWSLPEPNPGQEGSPYPSAVLQRLAHASLVSAATARAAQSAVRPEVVWSSELAGPWLAWSAVALVLTATAKRPRLFRSVATVAATVELAVLQQLAPVAMIQRRNLAEQSVVLQWLTAKQVGRQPYRVVGLPGNVAMLAGAAPVPGYRTLDIPVQVPGPLTLWAALSDPAVMRLHQRLGIQAYAVPVARDSAQEALLTVQRHFGSVELLDDPVLSELLYGPPLGRSQRQLFLVCDGPSDAATAWFYPGASSAHRPGWFLTEEARRVTVRSDATGLVVELLVRAERAGLVLWTVPFVPCWRARGTEGAGAPRVLPLSRSAEGWMVIALPTAGNWRVRLAYVDVHRTVGWTITVASVTLWLAYACAALYRLARSS